MKKLSLSFFVIVAFTFYALIHNKIAFGDEAAAMGKIANTTPVASLTAPSAPAAPATSATPPAAPASPPPTPPKQQRVAVSNNSPYRDGTFVGPSVDAYYGNIQVEAIIQNGKITDVQFLDYPQDRSTSRYINGQAMPLLKQEAIQAQSAKINGVSGATDSSMAFVQSLSTALADATK